MYHIVNKVASSRKVLILNFNIQLPTSRTSNIPTNDGSKLARVLKSQYFMYMFLVHYIFRLRVCVCGRERERERERERKREKVDSPFVFIFLIFCD